jgi:hypothetical protein
MAIPKVHSTALSNILASVGQRVEQFTETLDHVSDDIRAVEKWLQASGIRVRIEHVYRTDEEFDDDAVKAYGAALDRHPPPDELEPPPAWKVSHALAWTPEPDDRQWRILYISRRAEGKLGGSDWTDPQLLVSRPLIETPASVRLGIGNALEKLIEGIASMVPESYGQETLIEGELHVSDKSHPGTETGPWAGPWKVYFHKGRSTRGEVLEAISGYHSYNTWTEVLELVQCLLGPEASLEKLPRSFSLELKVPVRVLRELKLM